MLLRKVLGGGGGGWLVRGIGAWKVREKVQWIKVS